MKNIAKEVETPDLLFLNAGIYSPVNASEINLDLYKKHININYLGVLNSYEAFLPGLIRKQNGVHCQVSTKITEIRAKFGEDSHGILTPNNPLISPPSS